MGLRDLPFSARAIPFLLSHCCHLSFKHVLHQMFLYLPSPLSFSGSDCRAGLAELCLRLAPSPALLPARAAGHGAPGAVST